MAIACCADGARRSQSGLRLIAKKQAGVVLPTLSRALLKGKREGLHNARLAVSPRGQSEAAVADAHVGVQQVASAGCDRRDYS